MTMLDRETLIDLLTKVGRKLLDQNSTAAIYVVGGSAMALVFDSRRTTKDVDAALRHNSDALVAAARQVALENDLPEDWINSNAQAFMPSSSDTDASEITLPGLTVSVASPEHLIAMKLRAMRTRDLDDLEVLFRAAGITTPEQAAAIHDRLFSETDIGYSGPEESLYAARMVFDRAERQGKPLGR